jgi:hypothetical protein
MQRVVRRTGLLGSIAKANLLSPKNIWAKASWVLSGKPDLERVAFNQVHLNERNTPYSRRLACPGLHSI